MKKKLKVALLVLLSGALTLSAACKPDGGSGSYIDVDPDSYSWTGATSYEYFTQEGAYQDVSQLDDWSGSKMKITVWQANALIADQVNSTADVVSSEIERVTGVSINYNKIIDNAGSFPSKLTNIMSTEDYTDIVVATTATGINIINAGQVLDLTELLPEYAPNLYARMMAVNNGSLFTQSVINGGEEGKIYGIPYAIGDISVNDTKLDFDTDVINSSKNAANYAGQKEQYKYVYIRDDVLEYMYEMAQAGVTFNRKSADGQSRTGATVNAATWRSYFTCEPYSVSDFETLYSNGVSFNEEKYYFDVNITSEEMYMEFLQAVSDVIDYKGMKCTNGTLVETTYATSGNDVDTWNLMQMMFSAVQGRPSGLDQMFTYWDAEDCEVKLMLTQDFFKTSLEYWVKAIQDGLISDTSLADTSTVFSTKVNYGKYAITYPYNMPNNANLPSRPQGSGGVENCASGEYAYRKLYLHIEQNNRFAYFVTEEPACSAVYIFKSSAKKAKQILAWMDFQCTVLADRLWSWGPAGEDSLWEEVEDANGTFLSVEDSSTKVYRQFKTDTTDGQALKRDMVDQVSNISETVKKYNLHNGVLSNFSGKLVFPYYQNCASDQMPAVTYKASDINIDATQYASVYSVANITGTTLDTDPIKRPPTIWLWYKEVPGLKAVWNRRQKIEDALATILSSKNDAEFESRYQSMVTIATTEGTNNFGLTDELLEALDAAFKSYNGATRIAKISHGSAN